MAGADRKKHIGNWATKQLDKIHTQLREQSKDHVIHLWNVGQRLADAAEKNEDIKRHVLVDWAHQTTMRDDHKRRPDFARDDDRSELPFNYDRQRDKEIPFGLTTDNQLERIHLCDAGPDHLRGYLKICRDNHNAVVAKFGVTAKNLTIMIKGMRNNPKLKTVDDFMRVKYGWKPD